KLRHAGARLGCFHVPSNLIMQTPKLEQVTRLRLAELVQPDFLELAEANLIVGLDVQRVLAKPVRIPVHLGEEVGRRRRQISETRMIKGAIMIVGHDLAHHRIRNKRAALPHVTAPPVRASNLKSVQKPALNGSGVIVVAERVTSVYACRQLPN